MHDKTVTLLEPNAILVGLKACDIFVMHLYFHTFELAVQVMVQLSYPALHTSAQPWVTKLQVHQNQEKSFKLRHMHWLLIRHDFLKTLERSNPN